MGVISCSLPAFQRFWSRHNLKIGQLGIWLIGVLQYLSCTVRLLESRAVRHVSWHPVAPIQGIFHVQQLEFLIQFVVQIAEATLDETVRHSDLLLTWGETDSDSDSDFVFSLRFACSKYETHRWMNGCCEYIDVNVESFDDLANWCISRYQWVSYPWWNYWYLTLQKALTNGRWVRMHMHIVFVVAIIYDIIWQSKGTSGNQTHIHQLHVLHKFRLYEGFVWFLYVRFLMLDY